METPELLSVIVPVHNGAAFLASAVETIRAQGYRPLEILLIDDGSTDDTAAVAQNLPASQEGILRYVYQENAGPAQARNRGLELAQGDLIAFLDADDLWPEGSLAVRLAALQNDPALAVVMGRVRLFSASEEEGRDETFLGPNLGAALFRRSAFAEVGGFDATLSVSEDVDWFLRARERAIKITQIETITLLYRQHEAGMTWQRSFADLQITQVLKQSLERRRKAGAEALELPPIQEAR